MRLSKFFYLMSFYGGLAGFMIMGLVGGVAMAFGADRRLQEMQLVGALAMMMAMCMFIYSIVVMYIFIYKMWDALPAGYRRMSPGQAVGFLFIPFYNFYWIFMVWHGFAQDFNSYTQRNRLPAPPVPENLALALCILTLCSAVPYIGILPALANAVLIGVLVSNICDAVNALPGPGAYPPPPPSGYPPSGAWQPPAGGTNLSGGGSV